MRTPIRVLLPAASAPSIVILIPYFISSRIFLEIEISAKYPFIPILTFSTTIFAF
jgi:hypothetical protein